MSEPEIFDVVVIGGVRPARDTDALAADSRWNAPLGAYLPYERLSGAGDPAGSARDFIVDRLSSLHG